MSRAEKVYRHSLSTRLTHWLAALSLVILFMSGLQIFNAAPFLDASDKTDPARRVLEIGAVQNGARENGFVNILGLHVRTTGVLGYTDDGMGGQSERAFPGWITMPGYQSLADGRRWHLFFAWILVIAGLWYFVAGAISGKFRKLVISRADLSKLVPMQLYYLKLRKEPPPYGEYNPLQKMAYTVVIFVFAPLIVISGLALSPGVDAIAGPLTSVLGGRQFARLWHFVLTFSLLGFTVVHLTMVFTQGAYNNVRSMVTGWYRPGTHEVSA